MITTTSFMKREFGSKLIESFLPRVDLNHLIDTSGAYIPGHGTPTVILFGRDRRAVGDTVRTVMGIKGEPTTPDDAAHGLVWQAIVAQLDRAGSESAYVSVADTPRATFAKHPWSIGGGGAADLKAEITQGHQKLDAIADSVGITSFTLEDEVFIRDVGTFRRSKVDTSLLRPIVLGDEVRDWMRTGGDMTLFPYDANFRPIPLREYVAAERAMWSYRTNLANNKLFGQQTKADAGMAWWEFGRLTAAKLRTPLSITFGEVTTHNHFAFDRGGKVFKQTAPVIKLPTDATEDVHLGLVGLLNSSVACFWLKQVCHNKRSTVDERGARQRTAPFEDFYAFNATSVADFPLAEPQPIGLARKLDTLARELTDTLPAALFAQGDVPFPAQGQRGGQTPDPGAAPPSTTDSPRVPERGETGIKE